MSEALTATAATVANGSKLKAFGLYSGYTLFFIIALVMSLVWTFPNRQLKTFIEGQARANGVPVSIGEMELRGIGGVTFRDLTVIVPAAKPKPARGKAPAPKPEQPTLVKLDELRVDFAILSAFSGDYEAEFEFAVGNGRLEEGRVAVSRNLATYDLEIKNIDAVPIGKMGLGRLIVQKIPGLSGSLEGALSGAVKVHWGGFDNFQGKLELELLDAVIRKPELATQGGVKLEDLRMGALALNVVIDKKKRIKVLTGRKGSDKATAVSLEGVDMFGKDIELAVEERSHVLIPPGKAGMRSASMWIHFAFRIADAPAPKAGGKEGEADDTIKERLPWAEVMKLAGSKLKPFERNGYVGVTCSGLLKASNCKPALPQVTVGTRRKARDEARKKKKEPEAKEPEKIVAKPAPKAAKSPEEKAAAKPSAPERPQGLTPDKIVAKPVPRPTAVDKKIEPRKRDTPAKDDEEDEEEEEEKEKEEDEKEEEGEKEDEEEEEEDEEDEDEEEEKGDRRGAKKRAGKSAKKAAKKATRRGGDKERREEEEEEEE